MSPAITAAAGVAVGTAGALLATPGAIRLARRTGFYDAPRGYRKHASPTPLLGGAAVLLAFLVALAVLGRLESAPVLPLFGAGVMLVLGTTDDRIAVAPGWRVLAACAVAACLYADGLGWDTRFGEPANLALTLLWVVGLVNAFNLMDNLDGACSTVAAISAFGVGVLAALKGQTVVSAMAFALCGACAGFLPWNLAAPARIFLGDGGSMPIGFLLAVLTMATARRDGGSSAGILVGAMLLGLPILDIALVSFSRGRRGVSVLTGGRDHLTHRLLLAARTPRWVAVVLAALQGLLCLMAIVGFEVGPVAVDLLALGAFLTGVGAVLRLDRPRWRPAGIATAPSQAFRPRAPEYDAS